MKLNIQIQGFQSPIDSNNINNSGKIDNVQIQLEADLSSWDRLTSADEQRKFIDNQLHVLDYHQQNPDAIKGYVKAVVGGIAGGIIEAVDEQINPATKLRRKVMRWLDAINPMKRWEKARHREDCECRCSSKNLAEGLYKGHRSEDNEGELAGALAGSFGKEA